MKWVTCIEFDHLSFLTKQDATFAKLNPKKGKEKAPKERKTKGTPIKEKKREEEEVEEEPKIDPFVNLPETYV